MAKRREVDPDDVVSVVRYPLVGNWTPERLTGEIEIAWQQYELWREMQVGTATKIQRTEQLQEIHSAARRLSGLLSELTTKKPTAIPASVRHDLLQHFPDPAGIPELYEADARPIPAVALHRTIVGVGAISVAAQEALKDWENGTSFRDWPGLTAQQNLIGEYLREIFVQAFGRKATRSQGGLDKTPFGRFVGWVWRTKSGGQLTPSTLRNALAKADKYRQGVQN